MAEDEEKQRKYDSKKIAAGFGAAADAAFKAASAVAEKNPKLAPVAAAAKTAKKAVPYVAKAIDIIPDETIDKAVETAKKGAAAAAAGAKKGASAAAEAAATGASAGAESAKKAAGNASSTARKAAEFARNLPDKAAGRISEMRSPKYEEPDEADDNVIVIEAKVTDWDSQD